MTSAVASRVVVAGPLAPFAPGFLEELERYRYESSVQYAQMLVMARLSGWLAGEGLGASDLTAVVLERFIAELGRRGYRNPRSLRGFGTLLGYLRRVGAVPVPAPPPVPAPAPAEEELLDRYRRYLTGERGVCERVARAYIRRVRRFLEWRARVGGAGPEDLTATEVSAYVVAECPGRSTRGQGPDAGAALLPCVPARRRGAAAVVGGGGPASRWHGGWRDYRARWIQASRSSWLRVAIWAR